MITRRRLMMVGACVGLALLATWSLVPDDQAPLAGEDARSAQVEASGAPASLASPSSATTPDELAAPAAPASTASIESGLLTRDGKPAAGRLLASRLGDDGAPTGDVVELVADEGGCLSLTALSAGWWRVESAGRGDSILGFWSRLPPRDVTGHRGSMLLGWQVTGAPAAVVSNGRAARRAARLCASSACGETITS